MTKTAWVFPGQGSQAIGMGADLLNLPKACLYVIESILTDLVREKFDRPAVVAGHSLGEYTALYAAGVFDFETGLRLVKRRAELMDNVSGGQMVALLGFDRQELELQIQYSRDVVLANDNSEAQVVISGTPTAVEELLAKITGAFHSPLMSSVANEFQQVLKSARFSDAKMLVLSNSEPSATTSGATLKQRLSQQMTKGVRWREISLQLPLQGIDRVVEIGPGKVLTGLIKRTTPDLTLVNVSSFADLPK